MLANKLHMRRMCNNNQEIRVVDSSCHSQKGLLGMMQQKLLLFLISDFSSQISSFELRDNNI